jgi:hypothetical protein
MSECPVNVDLISSDEYIGDSLVKINNNFSSLLTDACNVEKRVDDRVNIRTFFYYGPNSASDATSGMDDNTASRPSDVRIENFVNDSSQLNLPPISEPGDIAYVIYQKTGWYKQQDSYYQSGVGSVAFQRTIRVPVTRRIGICFSPGTQISTPEGNKNIESLAIGDHVYSFDPVTKEKKPAKVVKTFKGHCKESQGLSPLFILQHEKGVLEVTADHWVYTGDNNNMFKAAKDLCVGDCFVLENGQKSIIYSITKKEEYEYVYNINVEKYHNFIANGVLTGDYQTDSYVSLNKGIKVIENSVATPDGFRLPNDIKVGDIIYGFDPETLELVEQTVNQKELKTTPCVKITHEYGTVTLPEQQKIFFNKEYIQAKDLKVGDLLTVLEDTEVYTPYYDIESKILNIETGIIDEMPELIVSNSHNYIFNNIFVHNGGGCFPANTLISTPTGDKKIQDIQAGDIVYGFNHSTNEVGEYEVEKTFEHTWNEVGITSPLIEIIHEKGTIALTKNHWVYVGSEGNCGEENGYIEAGDLKVGNNLTLKDNTKSVIQSITNLGNYTKVYNFEVKDVHNYIASNVRVHNGGGGKGGGGRTVWEPRVETYYVGYGWAANINDTYDYYAPIFIIYRLTCQSNKLYSMDSGYPKYSRASTASTTNWNNPQLWSIY